MAESGLSRRDFLAGGAALGAVLALDPVLDRLGPAFTAAARAKRGKLTDIEHVVIVMQENRSFDHYFGTLRGVRGFNDHENRDAFAQKDRNGKTVHPFRVDAKKTGGGCTTDPDHTWYGQHKNVADGAMDGWLKTVRATQAPIAMSYFDQRDIPYYFALAEAFTVCDHYFCSAQGATDPNRSYAITGTIDPAGLAGGPLLNGGSPGERPPQYSWMTMPEVLETAGISWAIYSAPDSTNVDGDNTVIYFQQYHSNATLNAKALKPTFDDFLRDAAAGNLPQVSWVISPVGILEHPLQSTPQHGQLALDKVFRAVTAKRDAWAKTAVFVTFDENGGFFDHVPPPLPPPGTPGEFISLNPLPGEATGVAGPTGLGPRVPTMIVSPFSRGGFVSSDTFDHTSLLRFLETRFGTEVPNLSQWRRATCGDLTSAFNFAATDMSIPHLPRPRQLPLPGAVCSPVLSKYPNTSGVPRQAAGKPHRPSGLKT